MMSALYTQYFPAKKFTLKLLKIITHCNIQLLKVTRVE